MTTAPPETMVCANHPNREATLRCNRCDKPICTSCAVLTPTGYRCPECVRGQKKKFDTSQWYDYPLAIGIAAVLAYLGGLIAGRLGFFTLFIAPAAGGLIAEVVRRVVSRRRSRLLFQLTAVAVAVGGILPYLPLLLFVLFGGGVQGLLGLLWPGLYVVLSTSSAYYRLAGIQMSL